MKMLIILKRKTQVVDASLLEYYDVHFHILGISYKDIIRRWG